MKKIEKTQLIKMKEILATAQGQLYVIGLKLESFGNLLKYQESNEISVNELRGLGFALEEVGVELNELWKTLDTVTSF